MNQRIPELEEFVYNWKKFHGDDEVFPSVYEFKTSWLDFTNVRFEIMVLDVYYDIDVGLGLDEFYQRLLNNAGLINFYVETFFPLITMVEFALIWIKTRYRVRDDPDLAITEIWQEEYKLLVKSKPFYHKPLQEKAKKGRPKKLVQTF